MKDKNQSDEIQSRRGFFKEAAKKALPVLGAIALASSPIIAKAADSNPMGCSGCMDTCLGCMHTCSGHCHGGCLRSCQESCIGGCKTGCEGSCKDRCKHWCTGSCQDTCSGGCKDSSSRY